MRRDALQTFKNINGPSWENLREILAVFRRKDVKPQAMATAEHKFQKLVFNPANQKLVVFLDELHKLAKHAFGTAAHAIIEQFIYAKMPPHLMKSINQAHLENGTNEQVVTHLEKELELNCLEAPEELHINTVSQQPANSNADRPEPTFATTVKNRDFTKIRVACWKNSDNKLKIIKIILETKTVTPITLTQTAMSTIIIRPTATKTVTEPRKTSKLFTHPVRLVQKQTNPRRKVTLEPMQPTDRLPSTEDRKDRNRSRNSRSKWL